MKSKEELQALKVERALDGKGAMAEYIADTAHRQERTATLRAERLAREAVAPTPDKPPKKSKKRETASITKSNGPAPD